MASITPFPLLTGARRLVTVLILVAVVAAGASVEAASVSVTWNAPTTNADGTPLMDLAEYRIYLGTAPPPCPGGSFHTVSSPTTTPASGETVSASVTALSAGTTYFARITAVDIEGSESACSSSTSGVAQGDLDVTPTATTSFGSVTVNGTVDRTFTVQNTGSASISGAASVGAPFSIVAGDSFSLEPGASQTVTVRFRPTFVGNFAGNVNFIAGGDSVSRGVSGSATAGTSPTPPSSPTAPPAASGSPSVTQLVADAGGVTFAIAWGPASGAAAYDYVAAFTDGSAIQQGTVTAPSLQLRMPYHVSGAAAVGFVCIRSVSATGLQSSDQACSTVPVPARPGSSVPGPPAPPAPPAPTAPPPAPGSPSVTRTATDAGGVTFTIAWGAVTGATSYRYGAAFTDGSAAQQGTVTTRSFQLRMPYHVSGAAFGAAVCIGSVSATGQESTDQSCSPVPVPARPVAPPPPPPPAPEPPPPDYGWGVG